MPEVRPFPADVQARKAAHAAERHPLAPPPQPARRSIQAMPPLMAPAGQTEGMAQQQQQTPQNMQALARQQAAPQPQVQQPQPTLAQPQRQAPVPAMPSAPNLNLSRPAAAAQMMVPTEMPNDYTPVIDDEYTSLALPSRFAFYDFTDLYVKPFRGRQLAKLSRAHAEESLQPMLEAVSSVLRCSTSDEPMAFKLTVSDFYFVLYWLRQNSYTKANYIHTAYCSNPAHIHDVRNGVKTEDTLKVQQLVRLTSLHTTELQEIPDPEQFKVTAFGNVWDLTPATMLESLEFTEHPKFADAEFQYLGAKACFLSSPDGKHAPLHDRMAIIEELSADDLDKVEAYEKMMQSYGVEEKVNVTCKGCGASWTSNLVLDAYSFLSNDSSAGDTGS